MTHQHLWVDPFSGLSGDIWIGGWLALGVPEADLRATLKLLPFDDLDLRSDVAMRCGIQGIKASLPVVFSKNWALQKPASTAFHWIKSTSMKWE